MKLKGIVLFCLVIAVLVGCKRYVYNEPGFFVPAEGGFVEAWEPRIPEIAATAGLEKIKLRTYSSTKEFEDIVYNPEKYSAVAIEVPIAAEYNFKKLVEDKKLAQLVGVKAEHYITSMFDEIQEQFEKAQTNRTAANQSVNAYYPRKNNYALPLSCDYLVYLELREPLGSAPSFEYAVPGIDFATTVAVLSDMEFTKDKRIAKEIRYEIEPIVPNNDFDVATKIQRGLSILEKYSNDKTFQMNSFTYTKNDANQMVQHGDSKYLPILSSNYISMQYEEKLLFKMADFDGKITCYATAAIFPVRKKAEDVALVELFQHTLENPAVQYETAKARNYLPVNISANSVNMQADKIRNDARMVSSCTLPAMLYTEKTQSGLEQQLKTALSTRVKNQ